MHTRFHLGEFCWILGTDQHRLHHSALHDCLLDIEHLAAEGVEDVSGHPGGIAAGQDHQQCCGSSLERVVGTHAMQASALAR